LTKKWKQAMDLEIETFKKNNTCKLVTLPLKKRKKNGCKWVYTGKYKPDGTIERYKVSWCGAQRMSGLLQPIAHEGTKTWWGKIYLRKKNPGAEVAGS